jgi:RNA polymerase sigma-70 factor (family 1)
LIVFRKSAAVRRPLSPLLIYLWGINENYRELIREDFKQLFCTYFEDVRRYVLYRCGDGNVATDITQDVFVRIWEKQMDVNLKTAKALLYKMANDLYITHYRKEKVAFNFFNTWQPAGKNLTPEDTMNYNELKIAYEEALKTMPEKQRTVFLMNRVDELKYKEIADILGLSVKAVEKRMSQALTHLKSRLQGKITHIILWFTTGMFQLKTKTES